MLILFSSSSSGTTTKTHSIDALSQKTQTVTHSIDGYLSSRLTKTHSIDSLTQLRFMKTHSVDSYLTAQVRKTHLIDSLLIPRITKTASFDSYITNGPNSKTYSFDLVRKKSLTVKGFIDAFIFDSHPTLKYNIDAKIVDPTTDPLMNGTIAAAIGKDIVRPKIRISRISSNNVARAKSPFVSTGDDVGEEIGGKRDVIIDGYEFSSMKFAFADSDAITNDGFRIFPDFDKSESDEYLEKRKVPWISSSTSDVNGNFSPAVEFVVHYGEQRDYNMLQIVTDHYGKNNSGIITAMDVEVSDDGINWTSIITEVNGFTMEDPHKVQVFYYYDADTDTYLYTDDIVLFKSKSIDNSVTTSNKYIKFIINSVNVDNTTTTALKPKHLMIYEAGSYIYDIDLVHSEAVSVSIDEKRDVSTQSLSPIAASAANTFNIDMTLANIENPRYTSLINPSDSEYDWFRSSVFKIELGIELEEDVIWYTNFGKFLIDDMLVDSSSGNLSFSGRDFSKYLQESRMPSMVYEGYKLDEVIRDAVERAGIEFYDIDASVLGIQELSSGITREFVGPDEMGDIRKHNVIWAQDKTYWEFLQSVAYADLGAFYFNRDNIFIYRSKEEFSNSDNLDLESDFILTEHDDIVSFNTTNEMMKNLIKINYTVPNIPKYTGELWTSEPSTLGSTALAAPVDASSDIVQVGDISDWEKQGYFKIDNEVIKYLDRTDEAFLECERGWLGTTPAPHYPRTDETNWNFYVGDWEISGGVMTARNQGTDWGRAIMVNNIPGSTYTINGKVTISRFPYSAAVLVKVGNSTRYYRVVMKSVAQAGTNTGVDDDEDLYQLWSVDGATEIKLKATSPRTRILTNIPTAFQVQVDGEQISLFIKGSKVLNYEVEDTDLAVSFPCQIGLGAKGKGPTVFENLVVRSLSDSRQATTILFSDSFGKPIYEVKRYEATYETPAIDVKYYLTNTTEVDVIYFRPEPFKTVMYVQNLVDGIVLVSGGIEGGPQELFYIYGHLVRLDDQRTIEHQSESSITRYGLNSMDASLPWVQSDTHAKKLLEYLSEIYKNTTVLLNATINPNILIKLGDVVTLTSEEEFPLWFSGIQAANSISTPDPQFHVIGMNTSFGQGGLSQNLTLRSAADVALVPYLGPASSKNIYSCPIYIPDNSFYTTEDSSYEHTFLYDGYSETVYDKDDPTGPMNEDFSIPIIVWTPSDTAGAIDANNIMEPSTNVVNGLKTIVWLHGGYERDETEDPNDYQIKRWLTKIVRTGYNIVFVKYRGTGGVNREHFEAMSYLEDDIGDAVAVAQWVSAQGMDLGDSPILMGYNHGANMVYAAAAELGSIFSAYVAINGDPILGCTLQKEERNWSKYVIDRYINSLGDFNFSSWYEKSPYFAELETAVPVLMVGSREDTRNDIRNLWAYYVKYPDFVTPLVYKNRTGGWIFREDGSRPNSEFKSEVWLSIMEWLAAH